MKGFSHAARVTAAPPGPGHPLTQGLLQGHPTPQGLQSESSRRACRRASGPARLACRRAGRSLLHRPVSGLPGLNSADRRAVQVAGARAAQPTIIRGIHDREEERPCQDSPSRRARQAGGGRPPTKTSQDGEAGGQARAARRRPKCRQGQTRPQAARPTTRRKQGRRPTRESTSPTSRPISRVNPRSRSPTTPKPRPRSSRCA